MEQGLLKVEDLNIEFHDHEVPERVVNHLTMELRQGEILGIVGESGSGKSMTAMAIAGLLRRHDMKMEGKILFEGKELLHSDSGKSDWHCLSGTYDLPKSRQTHWLAGGRESAHSQTGNAKGGTVPARHKSAGRCRA